MPSSRPLLLLTAAALATAAATAPAMAQQKPSLWDLISPDRILARLVQTGILSMRTQFDVVYGNISVSTLTGTVTLTDVTAWPRVDWTVDSGCRIDIDRLTVATSPVDEVDLLRFKAQANGSRISLDCLPPEARSGIAMLKIETIALPWVTFDADYRISTSAMTSHLSGIADGLAAISLDSDLDYVFVDASKDMENPDPVVFLNSARLTVENLGAWEKLSPMIPAQMLEPDNLSAAIETGLAGMLGTPAPGESPSPARAALTASIVDAVAGFKDDPRRIVLETGFEPGEAKFLNILDWDRNPDRILDDLQPRAALRPQPARDLLPVSLVSKAVDTAAELTDSERLIVGTAFATGVGAPRDLALAQTLLMPAAEAGDGESALVLARALETRDPEKAYSMALIAAQDSANGATTVLDRIESALPFARVLELQGALVEGVEQPVEALEQLTSVRDEAMMRMSGTGRSRSYGTAALWAMIGSAAGDAESAGILDEIDEKVRRAGPDAAAVWSKQEANAVDLARSAWVGFDLPASFGGVK